MKAGAARKRQGLESLGQAGLFQRFVGGVPGFHAVVDRDVPVGQRTLPDLVIAFTGADEVAPASVSIRLSSRR